MLSHASADPFWRGLGSLVLVEAKHWQAQRVGKNEYVQLYRKLENRGGHCTLGILICTERFAETFHQESLRDSKRRLRVVPIDGEDYAGWSKRGIGRRSCGSWSSELY